MRLEGEVTVSGGENAAVAIIPAALLADSPSTIENIPDINDVRVVIEMLKWLGAEVDFRDNVLKINPIGVDKFNPPYELAGRIRASYYFAPVLLGVFIERRVPLPGGCDIGAARSIRRSRECARSARTSRRRAACCPQRRTN